jgi:hypothetical protein
VEQAALERLALPSKTPLPIPSFGSVPIPPVPSFRSVPVPPTPSFKSLGYRVVGPSYLIS